MSITNIAEYWIVAPQERQITVCKWVEGLFEDTGIRESDRIQSDVLPSFELNADQSSILLKFPSN